MSKKDYEMIAAIIKDHVEGDQSIEGVARDLANFFKLQNPRFNHERFLAACGA